MNEFAEKITQIADTYSVKLRQQILSKIDEMRPDDTSHYRIYRVLETF